MTEIKDDSFILELKDVKYSDLLAADAYFSFLTRIVIYFVGISILLPTIIPIFNIATLVIQHIMNWVLEDTRG